MEGTEGLGCSAWRDDGLGVLAITGVDGPGPKVAVATGAVDVADGAEANTEVVSSKAADITTVRVFIVNL